MKYYIWGVSLQIFRENRQLSQSIVQNPLSIKLANLFGNQRCVILWRHDRRSRLVLLKILNGQL